MPPPSVTPRTTVRPPLGARDGQAEADYLFYRLHDNLDRATARATGWTRIAIGLAKKTLIMTRKRLCTHVIQLVSRDLADFDMHAQSGVSTYSAQHAQTPSPLTPRQVASHHATRPYGFTGEPSCEHRYGSNHCMPCAHSERRRSRRELLLRRLVLPARAHARTRRNSYATIQGMGLTAHVNTCAPYRRRAERTRVSARTACFGHGRALG